MKSPIPLSDTEASIASLTSDTDVQNLALAADGSLPDTIAAGNHRPPNSGLTVRNCLLAIFAVWAASLALLFLLQLGKTGFGLKVWPMGEDRVWINLLQNNHGAGVGRAFWLINDRNPLSPWWYVLASPLILGHDYGIYVVRKLVDLCLASITFFLFDQLGNQKKRGFALSCGILVLLWNFSYYYNEQIMWNFLMALGLTASSILFYAKYLDSGRRTGTDLAVSVVVFFAAFSSYTLQCGAIFANFCLALLKKSPGQPLYRRIQLAATDAGIFGALFGLYLLSWATTSHPLGSGYELHTRLIKKQLWPSIQSLFWQVDYTNLLNGVIAEWSRPVLIGSTVTFLAGFYFVFARIWKRDAIVVSPDNANTGIKSIGSANVGTANAGTVYFSDKQFALSVLAVIAAVSIPTVLLESMSDVWFPGTRIRMIGEFVSPCLFGLLIAIAHSGIGRINVNAARQTAIVAFTVLAAAAALMGLQYNQRLSAQTAFERHLVEGLRWYLLPDKQAQYFMVRLDNCHWFMSPTLNDTFIQTAFNQQTVHLRVLSKEKTPPGFENNWVVEMDAKNVKHAGYDTANNLVPWERVVLVSYDGHRVHLINPVKPADVRGYQVLFKSHAPISQPAAGEKKE